MVGQFLTVKACQEPQIGKIVTGIELALRGSLKKKEIIIEVV